MGFCVPQEPELVEVEHEVARGQEDVVLVLFQVLGEAFDRALLHLPFERAPYLLNQQTGPEGMPLIPDFLDSHHHMPEDKILHAQNNPHIAISQYQVEFKYLDLDLNLLNH